MLLEIDSQSALLHRHLQLARIVDGKECRLSLKQTNFPVRTVETVAHLSAEIENSCRNRALAFEDT